MTGRADDDVFPSASDAITRRLVRLQPCGQVIRCGTITRLSLQRGQTVVVQTALGVWLAVCLSDTDEQSAECTGELLRIAEADDLRAAETAARQAAHLYATALQKIANERVEVLVVAAEVDLCGAVGGLRFVGTSSERLGPVAVQLAADLGLDRVQWVAGDGAIEIKPSDAPELANHNEIAFWDSFQRVTTPGPKCGNALGKSFRIAAGNRGIYQQKRRCDPPVGRAVPAGRSWLVRVRTAAGGITLRQLRGLLGLAGRFGDGTLRLTMRQSIQLHGVAADAPAALFAELEQRLLQTMGSCGHAVRNLTCCPLPIDDRSIGTAADQPSDATRRFAAMRVARELATMLQRDLLPRGPAFSFRREHADAPEQSSDRDFVLPHKFKIGVSTDFHDCADVRTNDIGFIVRSDSTEANDARRVDVYIGGSTAYRVDDVHSFATLGTWLATIDRDDVLPLAEALRAIFLRRGGQRDGSSKRPLRFKHVVRRSGIETLREHLRLHLGEAVGMEVVGPSPQTASTAHDWSGRTLGGAAWSRIAPPRGRLTQDDGATIDRWIAADVGNQWRLRIGTRCDFIVLHPGETSLQTLDTKAAPMFAGANDAIPFRACPSLPTCPQAVAAAETEWSEWSAAVEKVAQSVGVPPPELAISGCANGCARSLTAAIGLVAESPRRRAVYLGGSPVRLGWRAGEVETAEELAIWLLPWLQRYAAQHVKLEGFSDWSAKQKA